jgi:hypothetical protein
MPKRKLIRILHVPISQPARVLEIEDDSTVLRYLVGGYLEAHGLGGGIALMCNENGVALDLPQNGCGILGAFVFVKIDEAGESASLTDEECAMVLAHVAAHRAIRHQGGRIELHSYASIEEMLADRERRRFDAEHAN